MIQRIFIAYAFFTLGLVGISLGMYGNGSAGSWNPAWHFVVNIRNFCVLTWVVPGVLAVAIFGVIWLLESKAESFTEPIQETPAEAIVRRESNRIAALEREQVRFAETERLRKEKEQEKLREENLQRQIEEKRKKRTAEEAAKSALGDFL